jgi:DEAD/DEAH box helicase domain-containing protein
VYPTKALTFDQLKRIKDYYIEAGLKIEEKVISKNDKFKKINILKGSIIRYDGDVSNYIYYDDIKEALTVLTNPEILLDVLAKKDHKLRSFFQKLKLVVIDEFDFYGSTNSTKLLFLIQKLKKEFNLDFQLVLMSATISNPIILKDIIPNAEIISGKSYKPENNTYIIISKKDLIYKEIIDIISKDLKNIPKEELKNIINDIANDPNLTNLIATVVINNIINDKNLKDLIIKENKILIIDILKNILQSIINNERKRSKIIVFTHSINQANILYKRLEEELEEELKDLSNLVGVHHSKVPKEIRMEIEEKFKAGDLPIVISVKTMSVGIDIGEVNKIIHLGLPLNLSEFIQKEGRKGRRKNEDFQATETLIVPSSERDIIISKDYNNWRRLSPEKLIIYIENKILDIYEEYINNPIKELEFYHYSRKSFKYFIYDIQDEKFERKADIPIKELIEYYQPMYINYYFNGTGIILSTYNKLESETKILEVFLPLEKLEKINKVSQIFDYLPSEIKNSYLIRYKLALIVESECKKIYEDWEENTNFMEVLKKGKVFSIVETTILTEKLPTANSNFFSKAILVPLEILYIFESLNKKVVLLKEISFEIYFYKKYLLPYEPYPHQYHFHTYLIINEINEKIEEISFNQNNFLNIINDNILINNIEYSIAIFKALLRQCYNVDLNLIKFSIEKKFNLIKVWEDEPVGIIEKIMLNQELTIDKGLAINFENIFQSIDSLNFSDYNFTFLLKIIGYRNLASILENIKHQQDFIKNQIKLILAFIFNKIDYLLKEDSPLSLNEIKQIFNEIMNQQENKISLKNTKTLFIDYYKLLDDYYINIFSNENLDSDSSLYFQVVNEKYKKDNISKIIENLIQKIQQKKYDYIVFYYLPKNLQNLIQNLKEIFPNSQVVNLQQFFYENFFKIPLPLSYLQRNLLKDESLLENLNQLSFLYHSGKLRNLNTKEEEQMQFENIKRNISTISKNLLFILFNFYKKYY